MSPHTRGEGELCEFEKQQFKIKLFSESEFENIFFETFEYCIKKSM